MVGRPPLPIETFGKVTVIAQASGAVQARAKFRDFGARVRLISKVGRRRRWCLAAVDGGGVAEFDVGADVLEGSAARSPLVVLTTSPCAMWLRWSRCRRS
jgi:hypothetical protein